MSILFYNQCLLSGLVSLFSIPCIHYHKTIVKLRMIFYLIFQYYMLSKTFIIYRLLIIILILRIHTIGCHYTLENSVFFLEFSEFLMTFSILSNNDYFTYIAKLYWMYDRIYKFPFLILYTTGQI